MAGRQDPNSSGTNQTHKQKIFDRFSLHPSATYCYNCLILFACWAMESEVVHDQWKLSVSQRLVKICDLSNLCSFGRVLLSLYTSLSKFRRNTLKTPFMSTFLWIPSHGAVCSAAAPVADDLGRKQLCIDHKHIAWW